MEPAPSALKMQSLNHWTVREVPTNRLPYNSEVEKAKMGPAVYNHDVMRATCLPGPLLENLLPGLFHLLGDIHRSWFMAPSTVFRNNQLSPFHSAWV